MAYALNLNFCLLLDARRPDLLERVVSCHALHPLLNLLCKLHGPYPALTSSIPARDAARISRLKYGINDCEGY